MQNLIFSVIGIILLIMFCGCLGALCVIETIQYIKKRNRPDKPYKITYLNSENSNFENVVIKAKDDKIALKKFLKHCPIGMWIDPDYIFVEELRSWK